MDTEHGICSYTMQSNAKYQQMPRPYYRTAAVCPQ